jgi:creatinine amidohydrolase/Fe(II)-dependent formamide hydrolase-like protein
VLLTGISDHHLGFPGTIAISPETFQAVLFETAQSLIAHGFRRLLFYSGHGGNGFALASVIDRINRETPACAIDLTKLAPPPDDAVLKNAKFDYHAGVEETSVMMHVAPRLVHTEKLENPVLTIPSDLAAIYTLEAGGVRDALDWAVSFVPKATGKHTSTRELSNNGVFTFGRLEEASSEIGASRVDSVVQALVRAINTWRAIPSATMERPAHPGK